MTKSWSSFEKQKLLQEKWRDFLREETGFTNFGVEANKFFAAGDKAYGTNTDDGDDKKTFGLDSGDNSESLLNILRQQTPFLEKEQAKLLISIISQVAEDEGIMLELSLKGLNSEQDRVIDADGSAEILSVIAGFNLDADQNRALLKALNQWGRLNSVKFSKPSKPTPTAPQPEEPPPSDVEPDEQDDEQDDEEGGVVSKIKDVGGKIQNIASSDTAKAVEGVLDGLSLIPGANIPASLGAFALNVAQGEPKEAALSLLSLIPVAGAAGKLGKFGPVLMKLAPYIKTLDKARGAKGAKEALQIALEKAGTDISVEDLQKASNTAIDMYDKLAGLPGIGDQVKDTVGQYIEPLRNAQEFMNSTPPDVADVASGLQNPDPPMDTVPITRDPPKDRAVNIQQIKGSGPAEPEPEAPAEPEPEAPAEPDETGPELENIPPESSSPPGDDEIAYAGGDMGWVTPTPENARKGAIDMFSTPKEYGYRRNLNALRGLEKLRDMGAGLLFKDAETEEVMDTPEWIPNSSRHAEEGEMVIPALYGVLELPRTASARWRKIKDYLNPLSTGGLEDTSFHSRFSSDVGPQAIENLEDVIEQMRVKLQSMRKPADAEALQETYDRWKTIAGINPRVL